MQETTTKLLHCLDVLSCGNTLTDKDITKDELRDVLNILFDLKILIGHPEDTSLYNSELLDNLIKNSTCINSIYYKGSDKYKKLISTNKDAKYYHIHGKNLPSFEINHDLKDPIIQYSSSPHFLYEYMSFGKEENSYVHKSVKIMYNQSKCTFEFKFVVPLYFNISKLDEDNVIYEIDENDDSIYYVSIGKFKDLNNYNENRIKAGKFIKKAAVRQIFLNENYNVKAKYVKDGDRIIYKKLFEKGEYKSIKQEFDVLNEPFFIDAAGNKIDSCDITSSQILSHIRTSIAHNKNQHILEYKLNSETREVAYGALIFLFENKALAIPSYIYPAISNANMTTLGASKSNFNFLLAPKFKYLLNSDDNITRYLKSCKKVSITIPDNFTYKELKEVYEEITRDYGEDKFDEFNRDYFVNSLTPIFGKVKVDVQKISNIEVLKRLIIKNEWFHNNCKDYNLKSTEYIRFLLEDLYDFEIVKTKITDDDGKINSTLHIGTAAILYLLNYLIISIDNVYEVKDKKSTIDFTLYKNELYILRCILFIYFNLVLNNYDDDLDKRKTKLNENESFRMSSDITLNTSIFKDFRYRYTTAKGKAEKSINSYELCDKAISTIRNKIAHFDIDIKFNKLLDIESAELIFKANDTTSFKIKCNDFLTFINNKIFTEHKNYRKEVIKVDSFKKVLETMKEKLNDYK